MHIYVFTSDKYHHALPPFAHLFNKYFDDGQDVTVVGYAEPTVSLPENFSFISLGKQEDYPWKKYSDALIKFLEQYAPPTFVLMLEDYWLCRQANVDQVQSCYDYTRSHPDVLRFDICADRLTSSSDYASYHDLDIIRSDPNSMYHMSLWTSVFNRDQMKRVIIPDESPHDIEIFGTTRTRALDPAPLVLGTRQYPLRHIAALRGQNSQKWELGGLSEQDRQELQEKGWL
ncbi:MAG: hypothetical protein ACF8NJ_04560 [Phycisphaerales bacterium JB038]